MHLGPDEPFNFYFRPAFFIVYTIRTALEFKIPALKSRCSSDIYYSSLLSLRPRFRIPLIFQPNKVVVKEATTFCPLFATLCSPTENISTFNYR